MRYGWVILLVSIILGLFVALLVILSPSTVLAEPAFRAGDVQRALRAWGVTWLFFNVIARSYSLGAFAKGSGGRGGRCGYFRCCGFRTF